MNKTQAIFATLTARYGRPVPREGQELQAVAQSFEVALGAYSLDDLAAACQSWMSTSTKPFWPEPAQLIEILKSFGARQEQTVKQLPLHVKMAAEDASRWYNAMIVRPLPAGAWPCTWDDALADIIGVGEARNLGKSFAWMLTRAWLDGLIPALFDQKAAAYFEQARAMPKNRKCRRQQKPGGASSWARTRRTPRGRAPMR